jgi:serine/threonine-protein kinase
MSAARLADPDPWRDRVRDPWHFWDASHIKDLAEHAPMEGESLQLLVGLGERLMHEDQGAAVPYLYRVLQQYPDDFYVNFTLGRALYPDGMALPYFQAAMALRPDAAAPLGYIGVFLKSQGHSQEALQYLQRALQFDAADTTTRAHLGGALFALGRNEDAIAQYKETLRLEPQVGWIRNEYGMALQRTGALQEAIEQFQEAIKYDGRNTWARYNLADVLCQLGRPSQAIEQLRGLVAVNPSDEPAEYRLSQLLIDAGQLEEARASWQKGVDTFPDDHGHWFGYAELCLYLGNADEYRRNRLNLLVNFGENQNPTLCERTAKTCLLLPWDEYELRRIAALADRAEAADREGHDDTHPYDLFAQGLAAYRLGQYDKAIALMTGDAARVTPPCPKLVTGMALYKKGEKDQAAKILAEATQSFDWNQKVAANLREEFWVAHILRREADSMIQQSHPRENSTSAPVSSTAPAARE